MKLSESTYEMVRGFPRPRSTDGNNFPVPYVAKDLGNVAALDGMRDPECTILKLCQMCGLGFSGDPEEMVCVAIDDGGEVGHDHGLTHPKCSKIVQKFCPAFHDPDFWIQLRMVEVSHGQACELIDGVISRFDYLRKLRDSDIFNS